MNIVNDVPGIAGMMATLAVALSFTLIGSYLPGSAGRPAGADAMIGFGLSAGFLSIVSGLTAVPVSYSLAALGAVAAMAGGRCLRSGTIPGGVSLWTSFVLMAPLLAIAVSVQAVRYDDFWHWLPSAAYLFRYDSLFHPGLPEPLSVFPGYPQSIPFVVAASSWICGRFVENAGAVLNIAMLASFAGILAEVIAEDRPSGQGSFHRIVRVGVVTAFTTIFFPGMNYGVLLSSYADTATMAVLGGLGLLGAIVLRRLHEGRRGEAADAAIGFGFAAAALVNLKQANIVLFGLLCLGFLVVALLEGGPRGALRLIPRMLLPALVVFVAWRLYVVNDIRSGEMAFRGLEHWNWTAVPDMIKSLSEEIFVRNPLFNAMMWAISAVGIIRSGRTTPTSGSRLALVCAIVWIGYNGFLIIIYLGAMTSMEAAIAADFWRYTPHVGLLGVAAAALSLVEMPLPAMSGRAATVCAALCTIIVPTVLAADERGFDPSGHDWAMTNRTIGRAVSDLLPAGSRLMIVLDNWFDPYYVGIGFDLLRPGRDDRKLSAWGEQFSDAARKGMAPFKTGKATHLMITDGAGGTGGVTAALGLPPVAGEAVLFAWTGAGFRRIASWPVEKRADIIGFWPIGIR